MDVNRFGFRYRHKGEDPKLERVIDVILLGGDLDEALRS